MGATVDYGVQVYSNYQRGLTGIDAWTVLDIESMAGSAWHGGVSGAAAELFGLALPVGGWVFGLAFLFSLGVGAWLMWNIWRSGRG